MKISSPLVIFTVALFSSVPSTFADEEQQQHVRRGEDGSAAAARSLQPNHAFCSHNNCQGAPGGGPWCNVNEERCTGNCAGQWCNAGCRDPVGAVLAVIACLESSDSECLAAAYVSDFKRTHNEVLAPFAPQDQVSYWNFVFQLFKLEFDVKFSFNPPGVKNLASIRYFETLTSTDGVSFGLPASTEYPFSTTLTQFEDGLVTVDDDCKIVRWDNYGDNKEQLDVDLAAGAILSMLPQQP